MTRNAAQRQEMAENGEFWAVLANIHPVPSRFADFGVFWAYFGQLQSIFDAFQAHIRFSVAGLDEAGDSSKTEKTGRK